MVVVLGNWGLPFLGNGGRNWRERKNGGGAGQMKFLGKREKSGREKIKGEKNENPK